MTCGQPPGSTGAQGNCAGLFNAFLTQGYFTAGKLLGAAGLAVLGLIGMFWGAPLVARELETGTFRLAWTQGVTRTRWLAAKLAIAGAAAMAAGELFTLMVAWWSSPIHKANAGYTAFTSDSFHSGVAPAGYAAFAFALGVTAGLLIRRTLPAMAVTPRHLHRRHRRLPHLGAAPPHPAHPDHLGAQPDLARRDGSHQRRAPDPDNENLGGPARRLGHLQPGHHPGRPRRLQRASRALRHPIGIGPRHATTTSKASTSGRR